MKLFNFKSIFTDLLIPEDERASGLLPAAAVNPETSMLLGTDGTAGMCFECRPVCYEDERILERLNGFLNDDYPVNTVIQFSVYRSPDISEQMRSYKRLRAGCRDPFLRSVTDERISFIKYHSRKNLVGKSFDNGIVHTCRLVVSLKIHLASPVPTAEEEQKILTVGEKVQAHLRNIGLAPLKMDAASYIRFLQTVFNRTENALWRRTACDGTWQTDRLLSEQILDPGTHIMIHRDHLHLGRHNYIRTLSARRLPEYVFPGSALSYVGDLLSGLSTVKANYMITVNLFYPDSESLRQSLERKRQFVVQQSAGPILKFVPVLAKKKQSFDELSESLQNGHRPVRLSYSAVLMAPSLKKLNTLSTAMRNIWREQHFELMTDDCCQLPVFLNSLPFGGDWKSVRDLFLYFTISTQMAAPLLPVMGEWRGTGTFHSALFSRNGQLMSVSLHDSNTNKNAVIAAESGSGKSFFANELILSYLSAGAQIWVIDAGKSYKNICEIIGGDYLQFDESSSVCLNPFMLIRDYSEDEDAVVSLIQNMASQTNSLDEFQRTALRRIMQEQFQLRGNCLTVDDIRRECLKSPDKRIEDIGSQLYPFCSEGSYGRFFNGKSSIDFRNSFTVLELDELNGRRHLRQVVLLQLIYQIQQQVFLGDRGRRKIILIDEAWDLLKDGDVSLFLEHAYRKFRKYGGSAVIATQSVNDLYSTPAGQAIAENSATMFLLGQNAEAVESVRRSGRLTMSDGAYELLKTVHTMSGVYSEIFIKSELGIGVGRLIVSEFQKLLYSTSPEDVSDISFYTSRGADIASAVRQVLSDRKIGGAEYEDADRELLNDEIPDMPIVNIRENRASDGAGGDEDENKSTGEKTDREVL
jgi:conjugal transfer ATP-binding protein TraC